MDYIHRSPESGSYNIPLRFLVSLLQGVSINSEETETFVTLLTREQKSRVNMLQSKKVKEHKTS